MQKLTVFLRNIISVEKSISLCYAETRTEWVGLEMGCFYETCGGFQKRSKRSIKRKMEDGDSGCSAGNDIGRNGKRL